MLKRHSHCPQEHQASEGDSHLKIYQINNKHHINTHTTNYGSYYGKKGPYPRRGDNEKLGEVGWSRKMSPFIWELRAKCVGCRLWGENAWKQCLIYKEQLEGRAKERNNYFPRLSMTQLISIWSSRLRGRATNVNYSTSLILQYM